MKKGTSISIIVLVVLLFVVAYALSLARPAAEITSFEECVRAGNPVMESYPRQCRANDRTFTEIITPPPPQLHEFNEAVTLTVNQAAVFSDGLEMLLFRIDDSRCPQDVQCVWAGELKATLHLAIDGRSLSREVYVGEVTGRLVTVGEYTFTLRSISETTATIVVTKRVSATETGMSGVVLVGPTCPVERVPADPNCADKPLANTGVYLSQNGRALDVALVTDAEGAFRVSVPPGTYTVGVRQAAGVFFPSCPEIQVVVAAGSYAQAVISCDSGIR